MQASFIETSEFTEWVAEYLPDGVYSSIQQQLLQNPHFGPVMPGCGGLRKLRVADPRRGKGKRGGVRLIYLYIPEARWFYLLDIYGKDEKDDLTADEKHQLKLLANELQREARAAAKRTS